VDILEPCLQGASHAKWHSFREALAFLATAVGACMYACQLAHKVHSKCTRTHAVWHIKCTCVQHPRPWARAPEAQHNLSMAVLFYAAATCKGARGACVATAAVCAVGENRALQPAFNNV